MKRLINLAILLVLVAGLLPLAVTAQAPDQLVDLTLGRTPPGLPALAGAPVPSGSTLAVLDDFNRADGPIGPDWTVRDGFCNVLSNAAVCGDMGRATFNNATGDGNMAEADIAVNTTNLQYTGLLLNYGAGANNLFLKVQNQNGDLMFHHAGCYLGNNSGSFGLGFFALDAPFATAHMKATRVGNDVTIEFTNVDNGAQPPQTYVCTGAPAAEGTGIGILGYAANALLDNFGGPGGSVGPNIVVNPTSLAAEQCADAVTTQTLSICNTGDADLTWTMSEAQPKGMLAGSTPFTPVAVGPRSASNPGISASSPAGPIGKPAPSAHPEAVLWDQPLSVVNQAAYVDQNFSDFPDYASFLADDFMNAEPWDISTIFVPGDGWNGFSSLLTADSLTWQVYADCGGVPCGDPSSGGAVWSLTLAPADPQVSITSGTPGGYPSNTTLNLATPINLAPGHWWLLFYPTAPFSPWGQFGRQPADTTNGYGGQFINPGGGFGYGSAWQSWGVIGVPQQDIAFRLEGEVAQPGVPWLSEDPTSGTVPAGGCVDVTVTFDSTGLAPGDFFAGLVIDSNDPVEPQIIVPVQMTVLDCNPVPDIEVTPGSLLAEQCADAVTTQTLTICNVGNADLTWSLTEQPFKLGRVEVALPARQAGAGSDATASGPILARPAGAYTVQRRAGVAAPPDVLLVYSDYGATIIQPLLQAYGDLGAVDLFDAQGATPTLAELQAYDVVATWTNFVYGDPAGIGNVLADYVDAGGKVINLMFAMGNHGWQMGGRFMAEGYTAMDGASLYFANICLGSYNSAHPIMAGVTNVCEYYRMNGTYLTAGSTEIAQWADGLTFVAAKDNQTVVSINGYVGDSMQWTGQMPDVLHNAILWLAGGVQPPDIPWLSEDPTSGTVVPGGCQDVTVTFDSTGLAAGDYFGALLIDSNDPEEPQVTVPVQLTVQECGDTLTCGDIVWNGRVDAYGRYIIRWKVWAVDGTGTPRGMVDTTADLTWPTGGPRTRTRLTNYRGFTVFTWGARVGGTWTIDVTNMVKPGYVFVDGPQCSAQAVWP